MSAFAMIGRRMSAAETGWRRPAASASAFGDATLSPSYRAASRTSQELAGYWPGSTSADSAVLPHKRVALDRARDLVRNDPHAGAGIARLVDMLVGAGLNLMARPNAKALGIDPATAREIGRTIESEWQQFANDPRRYGDARRRLTMGGMMRLLARTFVVAGEATAVMTMRDDAAARYRTCVLAIDPDRLCNPPGQAESERLRAGVEFDAAGAPVAYHVRNRHPSDHWATSHLDWARIPRETAWGRPVFVHGFEPEREDQTRGMTIFAALVERLRMIDKFAGAELASATLNALFTAFVTSNMAPADAAQQFNVAAAGYGESRLSYYEAAPPTVGGVRIPVLPIGDEIKINSTPRQTTAFPAFETAFLQSIASRLGISYEQLKGDWSKTNYSSARAALNEVWRMVSRLLAQFTEQIVTPIYFAWLEEAFVRGYVAAPAGVPDFAAMPVAWAQARWIGPGRGYVDPVKEAEASSMRMNNLTSTLADECAEQGKDVEEVLDQHLWEKQALEERGLTRLVPAPGGGARATNGGQDIQAGQDGQVQNA